MTKIKQTSLFTIAYAFWTLIAALLLFVLYEHIRIDVKTHALIEARALLEKDKATRIWVSNAGGAYMEQSQRIVPNPYLAHIPHRDINIHDKNLTLINPAYMLRMIMEDYESLYGIKGHITSLIHYREETAPDSWEVKALRRFEAGEEEVVEISKIDGLPHLRIMQPLGIDDGCLKCHGVQGYKVGDVRGGVSLSVPMDKHKEMTNQLLMQAFFYVGLCWIFGILFIRYFEIKIKRILAE